MLVIIKMYINVFENKHYFTNIFVLFREILHTCNVTMLNVECKY